MIFFIILVAIAAGLFVYFSSRKKNIKKDSPTVIHYSEYEKKDSGTKAKSEDTDSRVHIGDGLTSTRPAMVSEEEHVITKIYTSRPKKTVWICPYCEVENQQSETVCCVCCKER